MLKHSKGTFWDTHSLPINLQAERMHPIVTIEGHNGVGKSTITQLACEHFNSMRHLGVPDLFLEGGRKYRMIVEASWEASALYFLSGVADKLREISELNNPGGYFIERSLWSTLSAHTSEDPERLNKLLNILSELGIQQFEPDYTVILTAPFQQCIDRISNKDCPEEITLDKRLMYKEYYEVERAFYSWLEKQRPDRVLLVDCSGRESSEVFLNDVLPYLTSKLNIK
jgi:thymidylate kinase